MDHHDLRTTITLIWSAPFRPLARRIVAVVAAGVLAAAPCIAQAQDEPVPTPALLTQTWLTQTLSCQSRDGFGAFGDRLFLRNRPPAWMRPSDLPQALSGMIGLYGFAVDGTVSVFGEPVDHVYFMKDWVVALLPRASAERVIRAQKMARAPIAVTEQYYRFVDPEVGPMVGGFAPTGDAIAKMVIDAFGAGPAAQPTEPLSSRSAEMLLVGCNYAVASEEDFLAVARGAEDVIRKAGADLRGMANGSTPRPAQ